jgi:hypothetical protein
VNTKGPIVIAADIAAGRLASGVIDRMVTSEEVKVTCRTCGGVTVFAVHVGAPRDEGPCLHCGRSV